MLNNETKIMFAMFFIICFVIIFIYAINGKRNTKSRKELVANNNFIKNNQAVIEKIMNDNSNLRKNYLIKMYIALFILICAIIMFFALRTQYIFSFISICLLVLAFISIMVINYKYNAYFKYYVVKKIINIYNTQLLYEPEQGFDFHTYQLCRFNEQCDIFSSEDLIYDGNDFMYADILVESEYQDSDGKTHTSTEYQGSLAKKNIRDCECEIYLGSVRKHFYSREGYEVIKFENDEFNKLFSAYTNNELLSYKILTPDVMEEFVHLKKNTYGDIDIRMIYDKLYIRFSSGDGFVPNLLFQKIELKSIISSIAVLDEVINTMNNVNKIIEKKVF